MIGTTNLTFKKGSGSFICPTCGSTQDYLEKSVRRFFTIYFIPLIPLDSVGRFVECQACKDNFNTEVLSLDEETIMKARHGHFIEHCRRLMILMMLADGKASDNAFATINDRILRLGGSPFSEEEMDRSMEMALEAEISVSEYAFQIAPRLTDEQKEEICRCLFLVASADGDLGDIQQVMLQNLPGNLGLGEDVFREIVMRAAEE